MLLIDLIADEEFFDPNVIEVGDTSTDTETAFDQDGGPVLCGNDIIAECDFGGTLDTPSDLTIIDVGDFCIEVPYLGEAEDTEPASVGDLSFARDAVIISDTIECGDTSNSRDYVAVIANSSPRVLATGRYRR